MQGTVSKFDPDTRSGAVLTDTGIEIPFRPEALAETPVRFLRPGQRVRLDTAGTGETLTITAVRFITLP
jgi:cold shock CspA family protein